MSKILVSYKVNEEGRLYWVGYDRAGKRRIGYTRGDLAKQLGVSVEELDVHTDPRSIANPRPAADNLWRRQHR